MPATGAVSRMKLKTELVVKHVGDPVSGNHHKQRMAVGGRTDDCLGGDLPLGTRSVLDDEWLAETLRQPLTNQAREDVGRTAGRKADHDTYRSRRIGLRPGDGRQRRERSNARGQMQKSSTGKCHGVPALVFAIAGAIERAHAM